MKRGASAASAAAALTEWTRAKTSQRSARTSLDGRSCRAASRVATASTSRKERFPSKMTVPFPDKSPELRPRPGRSRKIGLARAAPHASLLHYYGDTNANVENARLTATYPSLHYRARPKKMNHGEIVSFLWGVADLIRDTLSAASTRLAFLFAVIADQGTLPSGLGVCRMTCVDAWPIRSQLYR